MRSEETAPPKERVDKSKNTRAEGTSSTTTDLIPVLDTGVVIFSEHRPPLYAAYLQNHKFLPETRRRQSLAHFRRLAASQSPITLSSAIAARRSCFRAATLNSSGRTILLCTCSSAKPTSASRPQRSRVTRTASCSKSAPTPQPRHFRPVVHARMTPLPPRSGPALPLPPLLRFLPPEGGPVTENPPAERARDCFGSRRSTTAAIMVEPERAARRKSSSHALAAVVVPARRGEGAVGCR